ncbi:MAG: hypothetical protein IH805_09365, partial [Proteobacteria bacterium]|nr:hypothetical protein [Pseudomonadota bacterium]
MKMDQRRPTSAPPFERAGGRALAVGLGALALGYVMGFSPLLVRNVLVGAP